VLYTYIKHNKRFNIYALNIIIEQNCSL